jgi:hypothetical protein
MPANKRGQRAETGRRQSLCEFGGGTGATSMWSAVTGFAQEVILWEASPTQILGNFTV